MLQSVLVAWRVLRRWDVAFGTNRPAMIASPYCRVRPRSYNVEVVVGFSVTDWMSYLTNLHPGVRQDECREATAAVGKARQAALPGERPGPAPRVEALVHGYVQGEHPLVAPAGHVEPRPRADEVVSRGPAEPVRREKRPGAGKSGSGARIVRSVPIRDRTGTDPL